MQVMVAAEYLASTRLLGDGCFKKTTTSRTAGWRRSASSISFGVNHRPLPPMHACFRGMDPEVSSHRGLPGLLLHTPLQLEPARMALV